MAGEWLCGGDRVKTTEVKGEGDCRPWEEKKRTLGGGIRKKGEGVEFAARATLKG